MNYFKGTIKLGLEVLYIEGEVLEESKYIYTIKQGLDNAMINKNNILKGYIDDVLVYDNEV